MSRCYCCDVILTTQESVARFKSSGEFTDMCNKCIDASDLRDKVVQQQRKSSEDEVCWTPEEEETFNSFEGDEE